MSCTMFGRIDDKNQEFLYFNASRNANIPKRLIGKTGNVNQKSIIEPSPKRINKFATPRDVLNDFLSSTSVHGLQYFGKTGMKVGTLGKLLWTSAMLTGFVCLSLMVMQFMTRYRENPTGSYLKSFTAPIFRAPFPAVTICPFTPISLQKQREILDFAILPKNMSKEVAMHLFKYGRRITLPYPVKMFKNTDQLRMLLDANQWSVQEFLKILQPCEEIFESCWWDGKRIDCDKLIRFSHSSFGMCCSFNYLLEDQAGRDKTQPKIVSRRSVNFGPSSGLKLVMKNEVFATSVKGEHLYTSTRSSDGIGLIIHDSMDFPGLNSVMHVLQIGHCLEIAVNPIVYWKPVPLCVPEDENNLEYIPVYRYSNCYANCRIKAMIHLCGCVPFIFDYLSDYHRTKQCDSVGLSCIHQNMEVMTIVKDTENENFTCYCNTPCNHVKYHIVLNSISLTHTDSLPFKNVSKKNAILKVFMDAQGYQIIETLPAADATYLLASVGGIFGLFLGCSFLSLVEVGYFICLMCRAIFLNRKVKESTRKQRMSQDTFVKRRIY